MSTRRADRCVYRSTRHGEEIFRVIIWSRSVGRRRFARLKYANNPVKLST